MNIPIINQIEKKGKINTTDELSEGTNNLYYTDARVDDRLAILNLNDYPDWNQWLSYKQDTIVSYNNSFYKSLVDNNLSNFPNLSPSFWQEIVLDTKQLIKSLKQSSARLFEEGLNSLVSGGIFFPLTNNGSVTSPLSDAFKSAGVIRLSSLTTATTGSTGKAEISTHLCFALSKINFLFSVRVRFEDINAFESFYRIAIGMLDSLSVSSPCEYNNGIGFYIDLTLGQVQAVSAVSPSTIIKVNLLPVSFIENNRYYTFEILWNRLTNFAHFLVDGVELATINVLIPIVNLKGSVQILKPNTSPAPALQRNLFIDYLKLFYSR